MLAAVFQLARERHSRFDAVFAFDDLIDGPEHLVIADIRKEAEFAEVHRENRGFRLQGVLHGRQQRSVASEGDHDVGRPGEFLSRGAAPQVVLFRQGSLQVEGEVLLEDEGNAAPEEEIRRTLDGFDGTFTGNVSHDAEGRGS